MPDYIKGFSKKTKKEKIKWILKNCHFSEKKQGLKTLEQYLNNLSDLQQLHDEFSENVISNYYLPYAVAPNFLINNKMRLVPMVIEESSVVAAACSAANFWYHKGGFSSEVLGMEKVGHVHFTFRGHKNRLSSFFEEIKPALIKSIDSINAGMSARGGGLSDIELIDKTKELDGYYQLHCTFKTLDAMGANFINSCLESFAKVFKERSENYSPFIKFKDSIEIVMSILSNYVPNCLVRAQVSCQLDKLKQEDFSGEEFAEKFVRAVQIAQIEPYRAVTHNKGVMNGVDAVVLATGNDFRAIESGIHAFASRSGSYKSLTHSKIENGVFTHAIEIPVNIGTVGGVTSLHPLAKLSLEILEHPTARELMEIIAVTGLAQNFSAIRSLITTGIQKGHMRMHLVNILNQLGATSKEKQQLLEYFFNKTISHNDVAETLDKLRENKILY